MTAFVDTTAWGACFFATLIPIRFAQVFLKHNPRLFTALALFAMVWALLLPYYGGKASSELFAGFGGFLSVFVGALLTREARIKQGLEDDHVGTTDRLSLWMLPLIAAPTALTVGIPGGNRLPLLSYAELEVVWSTVISLFGLFAIGSGLAALLPPSQRPIPIVSAALYGILEIAFMISAVDFGHKPDQSVGIAPMTESFKLLYALAKTIYAPVITYVICVQGMLEKDRNLPFNEKMLRLIGI